MVAYAMRQLCRAPPRTAMAGGRARHSAVDRAAGPFKVGPGPFAAGEPCHAASAVRKTSHDSRWRAEGDRDARLLDPVPRGAEREDLWRDRERRGARRLRGDA